MTVQEAIDILRNTELDFRIPGMFKMMEAIKVAEVAMKEVEQYRALGTVEEIIKHRDNLEQENHEYSCIGTVEELKEAREKQPKADWIPCEERLPHTEMPVWTTHENGQVIEHYWYNGDFVNNYPLEPRPYPKVIAWMPKEIPQPYKKEGAE